MNITDNETIEIQTQIRLINNAYLKFNQQRAIVQNLEEEFQSYFDALIKSKGGDDNKKWQLDMDNKRIIEAPIETEQMIQTDNGSGEQITTNEDFGVKETLELGVDKV